MHRSVHRSNLEISDHTFLHHSATADTSSSSNYGFKKTFPNSLEVMLKEYLLL